MHGATSRSLFTKPKRVASSCTEYGRVLNGVVVDLRHIASNGLREFVVCRMFVVDIVLRETQDVQEGPGAVWEQRQR